MRGAALITVEHHSFRVVVFMYKNYRGETSERYVVPMHVYYGYSDWHSSKDGNRELLLDAFCMDRMEKRTFLVDNIIGYDSTVKAHNALVSAVESLAK